jgi:3-phosphoshikimate 1-carboxyvinyltransferase
MIKVKKSKLQGTTLLPPSKSHTLRAILLAALAEGKSSLHNILQSPDTSKLIAICESIGASIEQTGTTLSIQGVGRNFAGFKGTLDVGNSGILLRFLTVIGAFYSSPFTITGDESACSRPMADVAQALNRHKRVLKSAHVDALAPLYVQGPFEQHHVQLQGQDSQPASAFMFAAACRGENLQLSLHDPGEKPWLLLTKSWLERLNVPVYISPDYRDIRVYASKRWQGFTYTVPGDASTLAFPVAAALITESEITIEGVDYDPFQGDYAILDILKNMGAKLVAKPNQLTVFPSTLRGGAFKINDCIDALPILSVVACFAQGATHLTGAKVAKTKECDRIQCMYQELTKMNGAVTMTEDGLCVHKAALSGTEVLSYDDHRMAMALSVAGLSSAIETTVTSTACINKTYPNFVTAFQDLGASIVEV